MRLFGQKKQILGLGPHYMTGEGLCPKNPVLEPGTKRREKEKAWEKVRTQRRRSKTHQIESKNDSRAMKLCKHLVFMIIID